MEKEFSSICKHLQSCRIFCILQTELVLVLSRELCVVEITTWSSLFLHRNTDFYTEKLPAVLTAVGIDIVLI